MNFIWVNWVVFLHFFFRLFLWDIRTSFLSLFGAYSRGVIEANSFESPLIGYNIDKNSKILMKILNIAFSTIHNVFE